MVGIPFILRMMILNFFSDLAYVWDRYNWVVHAYRLMTNPYHLLAETPDADLRKKMRHLNGVFT